MSLTRQLLTSQHLITRPQAEARILAQKLLGLKIESLICPFSEIVFSPLELKAEKADVFVATSANALKKLDVKAFSQPIYVVGEATAEQARISGFATIKTANGDSDSLIKLLEAEVDAAAQILYLAGSPRSRDLNQELPNHKVKTLECYRAEPIKALPDEVKAALQQGAIESVSLFSTQAARLFKIFTAELTSPPMRVICLSPQIARAVSIDAPESNLSVIIATATTMVAGIAGK